jgi:hypothetical protein
MPKFKIGDRVAYEFPFGDNIRGAGTIVNDTSGLTSGHGDWLVQPDRGLSNLACNEEWLTPLLAAREGGKS